MPLYLPDELVVIIFSYLSSTTLYRLIHCDRRFYAIAIPVLYRSIRGLSVDKTDKLLTSLCLHNHIPPLVQHLAIDWRRVSVKEHFTFPYIRAVVKHFSQRKNFRDRATLLNAALKRTVNLTFLSIMVGTNDQEDKYAAKILGGCSLPLTTLTTSLTCDRTLMTFLRTTPSLTTLNLTYGVDHRVFRDFAFDSTHLPLLKTFGWTEGVPSDLVQHFIEGRPVERINLVLHANHAVRMFDVLGSAQQRITFAFIKFRGTPDDSTFILIASRFPKLRKLKVTLPVLPALERMSDIADAFRKFKCLKYLTLTIKQPGATNLGQFLLPFIRTCLFLCPTLMYIDLPQVGKRSERRSSMGDALHFVDVSYH